MKLYRVTQTITAMVVADAELDSALELGRYVLERDPDGCTRDRATCTVVARSSDIPRQACSPVFGDLFYAIRSCTQDDRRYVRFLRLSLRGEKLPDPPSQLRAFGVLR